MKHYNFKLVNTKLVLANQLAKSKMKKLFENYLNM